MQHHIISPPPLPVARIRAIPLRLFNYRLAAMSLSSRGLLPLLLVFLLALLDGPAAISVAAEKDLYKILGVNNDATDAQIKKAFRRLSLKYHPDKNPNDAEAQKRFMEVQEANEVLSDPDKRATYDLHGWDGVVKEKEAAQRGGGGGGIFDFFGGGGHQGKRKTPDFRTEFSVTLEDLYNGHTRTLKVARKVICKSCKGSGAKGGQTRTCPHCGGRGQVMSVQSLGPGFNIQMQTPCDKCQGKGKIAKHVCPVCHGSRLQMEEKVLDLIIERGMKDGQEIRFERAAEQRPDHIPGDVIVTLKTQSHSRFRRVGDDLHMDQSISLRDALLGHKSSFAHMDGHRVNIDTTGEIIQPDSIKILKGEGMPLHEMASDKGDLHIHFKVRFPRTLTKEQQEAIRALFPSGK